MTKKAKDENDAGKETETQEGAESEQQSLWDVTSKAYENLDDTTISDESARLDGEAAQQAADKDQAAEPDADDKGEEPDKTGKDAGSAADDPAAGKDGDRGDAKDGSQDIKQDDDLELSDEEKAELNERSIKRFENLAEKVKTTSQELEARNQEFEQLKQDHETLTGVIQETGASADQLGQIFDITGDLTSGELQRGQRGVQRAHALVQEYAKYYGIKLPSHDVLSDHPDLQQQVEQGHITQELAEQTAAHRNANQGQQLFQQSRQQQTQQAQQMQAEAQQAGQQLNNLQAQWQASDPDWQQKAPLLNQYAQQLVQEYRRGNVPAADVPRLMKERYDTITQTMQITAQSLRQQQKPEPNPVRPTANKHARAAKHFDNIQDAVTETYRSL